MKASSLLRVVAPALGLVFLAQNIPAPSPPFALGRDTTVVTGPVRADGSPDYLAAISEKQSQGVTPENNGFVEFLQVVGDHTLVDPMGGPRSDAMLLRQIIERCGAPATPLDAVVLVAYSDFIAAKPRDPRVRGVELELAEVGQARSELWTPEQHPQLAAFLKTQEGLFDRVVAAAERPRWWCPYVLPAGHRELRDGTVGYTFLHMLREAAADLGARATLRAQAGNLDGALRDALAVKRLALHVGGSAAMTERLLAAMLDQQANEALGVILASGKLSDAQCAKLAETLAALGPLAPLAESVDGFERFIQLDRALAVALNRPAPRDDPVARSLAAIDRAAVDWDRVLKRVNGTYDQIVAALREPSVAAMRKAVAAAETKDPQWIAESNDKGYDWLLTAFQKRPEETREDYSDRVAAGLLLLCLPSFEHPEELHRRARVQDELLTVLLAAARVKAQTGAWPATLEALVPAPLKALPKDPFSADGQGLLRYVLAEGRPRIYALGPKGQDLAGYRPNIAVGDPAPSPPPPPQPVETAAQRRDRIEGQVVRLLQELADCNGGVLPADVDRAPVEALQKAWLARHRAAEPSKGGSREEIQRYEEWRWRIMHKLGALSNGLAALGDPLVGTDWRYVGEGVMPGEKAKEKAILWYKPVGQRMWRVIRGDLSIHDEKSPPAADRPTGRRGR